MSATQSPSAAMGERTPPAVSTSIDTVAGAPARSSAARSAIVNGGRPERLGRHRRRERRPPASGAGGRRRRARRRSRARARRASVAESPGANDCTGLRAAIAMPAPLQLAQQRGRDVGLPHVGTGAGDDDDGQRAGTDPSAAVSARSRWSICASVCTAERVTRNRHVPAGTVGGRMAGTRIPSARSAAAASSARCSSPHTNGTMGEGWPGRTRSTSARSRRTSAAPSSDADDPQRGERGRGVGRGRRGREDVGAGEVLDELDRSRRTGDEAAERAERLRQRADAQHVEIGEEVELGPEDGVRLVDDEQRALACAEVDQRVDVGDVAVHREGGVGHDERAPRAAVAQQCGEVVEIAVTVDGDVGPGEAAPVDDRRVVELVAAHEHARAGEGRDDAEVGREARREQCGALGSTSTPRARARGRRAPAGSRR